MTTNNTLQNSSLVELAAILYEARAAKDLQNVERILDELNARLEAANRRADDLKRAVGIFTKIEIDTKNKMHDPNDTGDTKYVARLERNGSIYWLRSTTWTSNYNHATIYSTQKAAYAAHIKASEFMPIHVRRKAVVIPVLKGNQTMTRPPIYIPPQYRSCAQRRHSDIARPNTFLFMIAIMTLSCIILPIAILVFMPYFNT